MIRTLIEITCENEYDHARDLEKTLDKLGYERKPDADYVRYMSDFWQALADRGLKPPDIVEEFRQKRAAELKRDVI